MTVTTRLGTYAAILAAVLGGSFGLGHVLDGTADAAPRTDPVSAASDTQAAPAPAPSVVEPDLLAAGARATRDGYTLAPASTDLSTGAEVPFTFTVVTPDGQPLTDYVSRDGAALRLLLVRADQRGGLQWAASSGEGAGRWSTALALPTPGAYRVLVDFTPAGATDPIILSTELAVTDAAAPATATTQEGTG